MKDFFFIYCFRPSKSAKRIYVGNKKCQTRSSATRKNINKFEKYRQEIKLRKRDKSEELILFSLL